MDARTYFPEQQGIWAHAVSQWVREFLLFLPFRLGLACEIPHGEAKADVIGVVSRAGVDGATARRTNPPRFVEPGTPFSSLRLRCSGSILTDQLMPTGPSRKIL